MAKKFIFCLIAVLVCAASCTRLEEESNPEEKTKTYTESEIENIIYRIQSISAVSEYDDGSVAVDDNGKVTISFDIKPQSPAQELSEVWGTLSASEKSTLLSFIADESNSKSGKLPSYTIKSVAFENGKFIVEVAFVTFSEESSVTFRIKYGKKSVDSEPFDLFPASTPRYDESHPGLEILAEGPICLLDGTSAAVEFNVYPSDAVFDLSGTDCSLVLDGNGKPSNYCMSRIENVYDNETGELIEGRYRVFLEDLGVSASYDENPSFALTAKDGNGESLQLSSAPFRVVGENFDIFPSTGLPMVVINTSAAETIDSKEIWKDGATMTIFNVDGTVDYQGTLDIKGRGNSSWNYVKKPYAVKLDSKSEILGMPKHKRWCLLANWMDRTLIRNAVSFEIARKCPALEWTPSGVFVELILNGVHMGNYYLCEQIKVDKNRVNIAELDSESTDEDALTGGYLMEIDTNYDELFKFHSARKNFPWMFKDPDEVNDAQFNYMQNYVNEMEEALYDDARFAAREFANYMDLESFADYWLVYELSMNGELMHPKSCFVSKDRNGLVKAGPVWDFDWGTFMPSKTDFFRNYDKFYYGRLFSDPEFKAMVKRKWEAQKDDFSTIPSYIDSLGSQLQSSDEANHLLWPITKETNGDESLTYTAALERMKTAYQMKFDWLDSQISEW